MMQAMNASWRAMGRAEQEEAEEMARAAQIQEWEREDQELWEEAEMATTQLRAAAMRSSAMR